MKEPPIAGFGMRPLVAKLAKMPPSMVKSRALKVAACEISVEVWMVLLAKMLLGAVAPATARNRPSGSASE